MSAPPIRRSKAQTMAGPSRPSPPGSRRDRLPSQATLPTDGFRRPTYVGRRESGRSGRSKESDHVQRHINSTDPSTVVDQFRDCLRDIRTFCRNIAEEIGESQRLPSTHSQPPSFSCMTKPASQFTSADDYSFFVLSSVVSTQIWSRIFNPFHPAGSTDENSRHAQRHRQLMNQDLQMHAAAWRCKTFRAIDHTVSAGRIDALFAEITAAITREVRQVLGALPGELLWPKLFNPLLGDVLRKAYRWNNKAKGDIRECDLRPYVVLPGSAWDPFQMELFESSAREIRFGSRVISPVSLGLLRVEASQTGELSRVQIKAGVLLEEWFQPARMATPLLPPPPAEKLERIIPPPASAPKPNKNGKGKSKGGDDHGGGCCIIC